MFQKCSRRMDYSRTFTISLGTFTVDVYLILLLDRWIIQSTEYTLVQLLNVRLKWKSWMSVEMPCHHNFTTIWGLNTLIHGQALRRQEYIHHQVDPAIHRQQRVQKLNMINQTCRGSSIGRACGSYLLRYLQTSRSWVRAPPSAIPKLQLTSFLSMTVVWEERVSMWWG